MVRDTTEGKTNFLSVRFGPMFRRWADHLTKGRNKYPDTAPGTPNWTLASGIEEFLRAKESAARHFEQWLAGDRDEDHAAAVYFNINVAEYVLEQLPHVEAGLGARVVLDVEIDEWLGLDSVLDDELLAATRKLFSVGTDPLEQDASLGPQPRRGNCVSCECPNAHCHTGLKPAPTREEIRAAHFRAGI
jgi:hypothetical protein